jgi:hypothetical protein
VLVDSAWSGVDRCWFTRHVEEPLAEIADQVTPGFAIEFQLLKNWCHRIWDSASLASDDLTAGHHKRLFVADDYDGFDVEASKQRSRKWLALDGIDFRRIGKKSFWEQSVVPRLL